MSVNFQPKPSVPSSHGTSLGQMANAPLAIVLAQVRFSPYLTMANHIAGIQDALRKHYPAFRHEQVQSIEFGPTPGPPKVENDDLWNFTNAENREGFVIQRNSLVFMATKYETFVDFSQRHATLLECFGKTVPDLLVERLGLRCIDLIVPRDGEKPQDYVISGLQGCEVDSLEFTKFQSQCASRWTLSDGQLVFRFSTGVLPPFLPQDLRAVKLDNAEVMTRAAKAKSPIGLMDFDRIVNHRAPFSANEISGLFAKMHKDLSTTFKRAMSKHAETVWNSKP